MPLTQAFAADLQELFDNVSSLDPRVMIGISDGTISASAAVADEEMNRLVLQLASVAEKHGIRFPRVRDGPHHIPQGSGHVVKCGLFR